MPRSHLLVVDDETAILSTLKKVLSLEGYGVDVAGGVKVALEKIERCHYDLMLFDVALPDGDGVQLLQTVRQAGHTAPVLMMSGHASVDVAVRATKLGATDFLEKPLNTDRLLLLIANTLRWVEAEAEAQALRNQTGVSSDLLGTSGSMETLREQIARCARAQATVIIRGERGTGKELVARAIHAQSKRADGPLEKLNCAAVPNDLIESELFGHEAGAFTGATRQRRGKFERARGGTLFLDEVGDMPMPMQAKLLRVLQERELERVGGDETIQVDVRVVAATNRDLEAACDSGDFRPDLYDRLNVLPLTIAPLRSRRDDIPLLSAHFLTMASQLHDRPNVRLTESAISELGRYDFPGNVRELRNVVERLVILTPDDVIDEHAVKACLGTTRPKTPSVIYQPNVPFRILVEECEKTILTEAITHHGGQMAATARALGLERSHLYKKCKALGLRGNKSESEDTD